MLDNNNSLKDYGNSLKQLKTDSTNSPWVYISGRPYYQKEFFFVSDLEDLFVRGGGGGGVGLIIGMLW